MPHDDHEIFGDDDSSLDEETKCKLRALRDEERSKRMAGGGGGGTSKGGQDCMLLTMSICAFGVSIASAILHKRFGTPTR